MGISQMLMKLAEGIGDVLLDFLDPIAFPRHSGMVIAFGRMSKKPVLFRGLQNLYFNHAEAHPPMLQLMVGLFRTVLSVRDQNFTCRFTETLRW